MKRFLVVICCLLGTLCTVCAQNMRDLIKEMPDSVMPLLTHNNRLDMIDYLDSNMKAEISNRFGGQSEMVVITDDYVDIKVSEQSEVAFKLLPFGDDNIICMIHTCQSVADDSRIKFYSAQWKQLPGESFFSQPSSDDFLLKPDTLSESEFQSVRNKIDATFIKMVFVNNSTDMVLTFTTPEYMSEDDMAIVAAYLREPIRMKWSGTRFE
ncbi:MAG: DUF3256 family protein [Bacteroides sp.]|nr:DUF3256 family protein [Roseburia sp.]MCM1347197.1 DUF3256 family protein [Bacteroides sp.]MCM1421766.1 DUF3256 family protein [Bacteroides sp.]